jgi:hypothetical protein
MIDLPAARRASLSNFRMVLDTVSRLSQSLWLQHLQTSNNPEAEDDDVSGILLDNQSCNDSSIDGKKAVDVSLVVFVVSVLTVVFDNDGNVFALLFTRVRGLCLLRDIITTRKKNIIHKRKKKEKSLVWKRI